MRPSRSDEAPVPAGPRSGPAPYAPLADGLRLRVRVTPRARADALGGIVADGKSVRLRLSVTAPPHAGEANAAVIALLARTLRLPKSTLTVVAGAGSREKTIAIRGDASTLAASIDARLASPPGDRR